MTEVRVTIKGDKELLRLFEKAKRLNVTALDRVLSKSAYKVHENAITSIQGGSRSGRVYKRRDKDTGNLITHQASAPGEPPKTDGGDLVKNITVNKHIKASYDVGSRKGAGYGFWLEMGTSKMLPRPWLKPALRKSLKDIDKFIDKELDTLFK